MATARLPVRCDIGGLAEQLGAVGALEGHWESLVIWFPKGAVVDCSALTFLCAWGRYQRQQGRRLLFRGDEAVQRHLARLGLQEHMGLAYSKEARSDGPDFFVP